MKRLILAMAFWACASFAAAGEPLAYQLAPILDGEGAITALRVTIRLKAAPSGMTRLAPLKEWNNDPELGRWRRDLVVTGGWVIENKPSSVVVKSRPGASLTVRYRVISAYDQDPTVENGRQTWPVIRPRWFYAVGESLFLTPVNKGPPENVTFQWSGAPPGFGFASDLEHLAGPDREAVRPGTVDDIQESIVVGGYDLNVRTVQQDNAPLKIATVGRYDFGAGTAADIALKIINAERAFWRDKGKPFLVTMAPLRGAHGSMSYSGTGRSDAFAMWVGDNTRLNDVKFLLAHEYMHTWLPRAVGGWSGEPWIDVAWFHEGFSNYMAWSVLRDSGLYTRAEFIAAWNKVLRDYAASPERTLDQASARVRRAEEAVQALPYQRGALLAAVWDRAIRTEPSGGSSLADVLRRMMLKAAVGKAPSADQLFLETYSQVAARDARADLEAHQTQGRTIVLPSDAFADPCIRVVAESRPVFERGWDAARTEASGAIAGLSVDSPAYAAGVRDGMKIKRRLEGEPGDSSRAYVIVLEDGGVERTFRFMPQGARRVTQQRLEDVCQAGQSG